MTKGKCFQIDRIDPRIRIAVAVIAAVLVSFTSHWGSLLFCAGAALCCLLLSGLSFGFFARRLLPTNIFMAVYVALIPLTVTSKLSTNAWFTTAGIGHLNFALLLAAKGNIIMVVLFSLLGQLQPAGFARALTFFRVPTKLVQLSLFTVRYFELLQSEYRRLSASMRLRAFRPTFNIYTCKVYGTLVGMLLVRSVHRSERIVAAMKCRGFRGHFHHLGQHSLAWRDAAFSLTAIVIFAASAWLEWR